MQNLKPNIPLSLYIHIPWCVKKCPYCDFNSHALKSTLQEDVYILALLDEAKQHAHWAKGREIISLFFGGGTPSLFSGKAIGAILNGLAKHFTFSSSIEITLEANPGTIDHAHFKDYHAAGVNRLSLGVQSLNDEKLKALGRIHNSDDVAAAILTAKRAGFDNFNIDMMFGLPQQTKAQALDDLKAALAFESTHLSWYQLTLEPNTAFYRSPPPLPSDDTLWDMQQDGQALLQQHHYKQYEVSAYAQPSRECKHNRNYWEFGDYLGLGAGAHSKVSDTEQNIIYRFAQVKHPKDYLTAEKRRAIQPTRVSERDVLFEFMLNALRLTQGVPIKYLFERTMLSTQEAAPLLNEARLKGWLTNTPHTLCATETGQRFLNDLVTLFLP